MIINRGDKKYRIITDGNEYRVQHWVSETIEWCTLIDLDGKPLTFYFLLDAREMVESDEVFEKYMKKINKWRPVNSRESEEREELFFYLKEELADIDLDIMSLCDFLYNVHRGDIKHLYSFLQTQLPAFGEKSVIEYLREDDSEGKLDYAKGTLMRICK